LTYSKTTQVNPVSNGKYGVAFTFITAYTKKSDRKMIDQKFVSLLATLTLLELAVNATPDSKKMNNLKNMPLKKSLQKKNTAIQRLWLAINHRWMAYHVIQNLFDNNGPNVLDNESLLWYSFRMLSTIGNARKEFLDPIAGICIRFDTWESIAGNRTRLDLL